MSRFAPTLIDMTNSQISVILGDTYFRADRSLITESVYVFIIFKMNDGNELNFSINYCLVTKKVGFDNTLDAEDKLVRLSQEKNFNIDFFIAKLQEDLLEVDY